MMRRSGRNTIFCLTCLCLGSFASFLLADRIEPLPQQLEGVGVTDQRNAQVPLYAEFKDEEGRPVKLSDYFTNDKPVIITMGYYECPMLCTLVLNGLVEGLQELDWVPGQQFRIVTVSINPLETPTLARLKKETYLTAYGRPGAAPGWHFLTGRDENIHQLADALGFHYRYDGEKQQYAHPAGIFLCTPDGRLSRYIAGIRFDPKTIRLSLTEASEGRVGSSFDELLLYCYHYDASAGRYTLTAMTLMRAAGVLTVLVFAAVLATLWVRDVKRSHATSRATR